MADSNLRVNADCGWVDEKCSNSSDNLRQGKTVDLRTAVEQQGFAILPSVLTAQDIAKLLARIADASITRGRAGIRHAMRLDAVRELAGDERLVKIAKASLGPTAYPFKATVFDKSETANWLVMWHQDTALPLRERRECPGWGPWSMKDGICYAHAPAGSLSQVLALRVHLDDSNANNGPLRVLPRTHTLGVLNDAELHSLAERAAAVECLIPTGGVLAMRPLIVHASSKSISANRRRVLHIEYAPSLKIDNGLELAVA